MSQDIQSHIRQAVAHERAANSAEDKYEQQMKAAGYEMWTAFCMAARAAPERSGRRSEEKDLLKLYHGTEKRKWWDDDLAKVDSIKVKDKRGFAIDVIQWHLFPVAAQKDRGRRIAAEATRRITSDKQKDTASRRARAPQGPSEAEIDRVVDALVEGRQPDKREPALLEQTKDTRRDDVRSMVRELAANIIILADKAPTEDGELAIDALKAVQADLKRAVSQTMFG